MKNLISLLVLILCVNVFGAGNSQIITAGAPITLTGGVMTIPSATNSVNGYLSSTDWGTFNSKLGGSILTTKGDLLGFSSVTARFPVGTNGQILTADSTQTLGVKWSDVGASGVTSVALALPNIFTISGSPITSTGTLTGTFATQSANIVFAGPNTGSAATPSFRALVAADIPNLSASVITSGQIAIANGGTGASSKSTGFDALSPLTTLGDSLYGGASGTGTRLAGNTSATRKFKSQTGDGVNSAAPSWVQPAFTDITGSVAASQLPNPTASTLGGIESYAAVSNQWINTISTSGVPSSSQPAFTNISGSVAGSQMPALTSDVTTSAGAVATTVAKIQGTTVSGTTGTTNVVFSASPTLTGTAVVASATVSGTLKAGNYHIEPSENDAGNSSTAQTIDWSTGSAQKSTLTGSVTYTFTNPVAGAAYVLRIATGAGSFTATWPVTVKWAGGTAPTITATASKVDLINFYYDGSSYYGSFTQNY